MNRDGWTTALVMACLVVMVAAAWLYLVWQTGGHPNLVGVTR